MKYLAFSALFAFGLATVSLAQPSFGSNASTTLTGVQDSSNMWYGFAQTGYGFNCTTASSGPAYYINSIELVPGSTWDNHLTFDISSQLGNGFPSNDYTLGSALDMGKTYYWGNVLYHGGTFDSSIAEGIYSFDALFKGGTDSSASDVLFDASLAVEIIHDINVTVTPSYDTDTISPGGTSTVSNTVQNNMPFRTFVTTTWFISGVTNGSENLAGNFVGDWFDKSIDPGSSRTDLQSTWTASANQTPGDYVGSTGVVGGLYDGDAMFFGTPDNTTIHVVPEPASFLAMGVGLAAFLRLRRKA